MGVEKGSQASQWIRSKGKTKKLLLFGNDNFFCLANGQIAHGLSDITKLGINLFKKYIFETDGCPNRLCQR